MLLDASGSTDALQQVIGVTAEVTVANFLYTSRGTRPQRAALAARSAEPLSRSQRIVNFSILV